MKDFLGREFQIGDYFVFPVRHSSSMWMKVGIVLKFGTRRDCATEQPPIVLTARRWRTDVELSSRVSTLQEPGRAVIIRREDVPHIFLDKLGSFPVDSISEAKQ